MWKTVTTQLLHNRDCVIHYVNVVCLQTAIIEIQYQLRASHTHSTNKSAVYLWSIAGTQNDRRIEQMESRHPIFGNSIAQFRYTQQSRV